MAAILLHWLSAPLLLAVLGVGWWAEHRAGEGVQLWLYELHFSAGVVLLLATLARLGWRIVDPRPLPSPVLTRLHRMAAALVHATLYVCLLAALVSGVVNFLFLGPVRLFGFLWVPRLFDPETQEPLRALSWYVHHYSYQLLVFLLAAHVAAAFHHQFVRRDELITGFWLRRHQRMGRSTDDQSESP